VLSEIDEMGGESPGLGRIDPEGHLLGRVLVRLETVELDESRGRDGEPDVPRRAAVGREVCLAGLVAVSAHAMADRSMVTEVRSSATITSPP